jgi:AcrR family transcriptional regulator
VLGSPAWWAAREDRLTRRRKRANGITVERMVRAAIELIDADGLEALTVRRLAADLGTGSASLYRHVASRDELLVLVVDHVLGEITRPGRRHPPRERIEVTFTRLRTLLLRHPNLVPALPTAPLQGPNARRGIEHNLELFLEAGFTPHDALAAYLVLLDYALGSVMFDSAQLRRHGGDANLNRDLPAADYPATTKVRHAVATVTSDATFAYGLRSLIDGLELARDRRRPPSRGTDGTVRADGDVGRPVVGRSGHR